MGLLEIGDVRDLRARELCDRNSHLMTADGLCITNIEFLVAAERFSAMSVLKQRAFSDQRSAFS